MNTVTKHRVQEKVKRNGKWISHALERGEKQAADKGRIILNLAQETATDMLSSGSRLAKKASAKAVTFGKAHPVQVAVCGLALGFILGSRVLGRIR
jgi:hypothetical protein